MGYLPFSQAGGALLFHLLSKLYEHISLVVRRPETPVERHRKQGQGAAGFAPGAYFVRAIRHQKGKQERTKEVKLY
jgi:hypothetical protein